MSPTDFENRLRDRMFEEPRAGLEQRILQAHARKTSAASQRSLLFSPWRWAMACGVAFLVGMWGGYQISEDAWVNQISGVEFFVDNEDGDLWL